MTDKVTTTFRTKSIRLKKARGMTNSSQRWMSRHLNDPYVQEAQKKEIYDVLVQSELLDFLQQERLNKYDLIVAADVLPYFGDLKPLFEAISQRITDAGYFIFTTEISKSLPWTLELSSRFSHSPDYIKTLLDSLGFNIIKQEQVSARMHQGKTLDVMLYSTAH